jgi:hypothetical protein
MHMLPHIDKYDSRKRFSLLSGIDRFYVRSVGSIHHDIHLYTNLLSVMHKLITCGETFGKWSGYSTNNDMLNGLKHATLIGGKVHMPSHGLQGGKREYGFITFHPGSLHIYKYVLFINNTYCLIDSCVYSFVHNTDSRL